MSTALVVEGGAFHRWLWFATMERRLVQNSNRQRKSDLFIERYSALEVRNVGDQQALTFPPLSNGDMRMWNAEVSPNTRALLSDNSCPLVGVDHKMVTAGNSKGGLGLPDSLLVPTVSLISLLNLRSTSPCNYEDEHGLALALVVWRTEYDVNDYYLTWPRTTGSGIVIRPDLLARLVDNIGSDRLVLRDFVIADKKFLPVLPEGC